MQVIRARLLGFCMGVRRAVDITWRESLCTCGETCSSGLINRRVYTLGPLIHNPGVLKSLEERGILVLKDGELPPPESTVIIRAHGVPPEMEKTLVRHGSRILDATCPKVKQSQMKAFSFAEKGYRIFLAGEENHAEIIGIRGYVELAVTARGGVPKCFIAGNPQEAERAAHDLFEMAPDAKTVLIGQTTINKNEYSADRKSVV